MATMGIVRSALAAATILCSAATPLSHAQEVIPDYYREPGLNPNRGYQNQHFSEYIDPFTGKLKLTYVDAHIPGNGGLDINVVRAYTSPDGQASGADPRLTTGYGWTMHFGRLLRVGATNPGQCTNQNPTSTIDNPVFERQTGERQLLFQANATYDNGGAFTWFTTDFWQGRCASGAVTLHSPDGTRYQFDPTPDSQAYGTKTQYSWYVNLITDRHGNYIQINYLAGSSPRRITSLQTSDGRTVTYGYNANGLIASVTANGFSWTYTYAPDGLASGFYQLKRVTTPGQGGPHWDYTYFQDRGLNVGGSFAMQRLSFPQGGSITYDYLFQAFDPLSPSVRFSVVKSKNTTATGGRAAGTWTIGYVRATGSSSPYDITTINAPDASYEYRHIGYRGVANGSLWRLGLPAQKKITQGGLVQTETYTWTALTVSDEDYVRPTAFGGIAPFDASGLAPLMSQRSLSRNGRNYSFTLSNFDVYGNARTITEAGINMGAASGRTTTRTFCQNFSFWNLNRVKDETIVNVGSITRTMTASCSVASENRFGVNTSFTYTAAGDLSTKTDARGFTTSYQNYRRGLPQTEIYRAGLVPTDTTQNITVSRVVSATGNVASETDGRGKTRTYGYEGLNRLTSIGYPKAGTAAVSVVHTATSRTLTRGAYTEVTAYDGFGGVHTINRGGVVTQFRYDAVGRKTFESHPYPAGTTGAVPGTSFAWDGANRVVQITHADGRGKTFNHASGNVAVTDERGYVTTHGYLTYGDPDQRWLRQIAPASVTAATLTIGRNGLGQISSLVQNGVTRSYGYSASYFLTSETHPEIGVVAYGRDAVGNMSSKSVGSGAAARTTSYAYDGLQRLRSVDYPSPTADVVYTYTGTNKLLTANVSGGASRSQAYDDNDNLSQEALAVDGYSFTVDYGYDANDQLRTITYPAVAGFVDAATRTVLDYAPDALARPTKATPLVTSAQFYPSGQLKQAVHANGVTTAIVQDANRLWLTGVSHRLGTSPPFMNFTVGYDFAANANRIRETVTPIRDRYNWDLASDPINRLTTVNRVGADGTTVISPGNYVYDGNGNISSVTMGGSTATYAYNSTSKRLTAVGGAIVRSYAYDVYGSVSGDGEWSYGYDDVPNLKQITPAAEGMSAQYDALNSRVKTVYSASTTYSLHAASGELLVQFTPGVKVVELYYLARKPIGFRSRTAGGAALATHVHNDPFGNPVAGTAGAGQPSPGSLLWTDAFLPYGDRFSEGAQQAGYPLSFQGGRVDLGTDVHRYQFGARIYDPVVGRFLGWDPAAFDETQPASFNRYQYGGLNPYKYKDETGRVIETIPDIASLSLSIVAFRNDPSLLNGLGLAYDAAATFIPGLPAGAGLIMSAAKAGKSAVDAAATGRQLAKVQEGVTAKEITLSRKMHGEAAQHAADAIKAGKPDVLTIDRARAAPNRQAATDALDKVAGKHLDEYPPAMFREGGTGANVRPINPRDNMSAGACIGNACRGLPDGTRVRIKVGD